MSEPTPPAEQSSDKKSQYTKEWFIENFTSLGLALLLVFAFRSSIVEAFKIPSGSMIPTLLVGDHIFVNKFAYGLKFPFTDWFMTDPVTLISREGPKRGDIVVFKYPKDESIYFIKRVIGLPGDTVEIKAKKVYITGKPIEWGPTAKERIDQVRASLTGTNYHEDSIDYHDEAFGDDKTPTIMTDRANVFNENWGPVTVPADQYFVMGDNRDFSHDSRFWGFVPRRNVKGRAILIWASFDFNSADFNFTFRPERIGRMLH